ncbi:centrosomal protein 20-like [Watersipora subatra]|uniref:centrosomal protein 20-like n=1 Tax=Watersipora subatra TaxID=2589382 RepID=UPI00355B5371
MAHLEDLKSVIVESLERRGVLSSIQGKMRAEVFNALDDKSVVKPKASNDTILINQLIQEYLNYNNYKYAAMTLAAESGESGLALSREFIESELGVTTTQKTRELPLLYSLVHDFAERRKRQHKTQAGNTFGTTEQYDSTEEHDRVAGQQHDSIVESDNGFSAHVITKKHP